jgi:hypothetical protein
MTRKVITRIRYSDGAVDRDSSPTFDWRRLFDKHLPRPDRTGGSPLFRRRPPQPDAGTGDPFWVQNWRDFVPYQIFREGILDRFRPQRNLWTGCVAHLPRVPAKSTWVNAKRFIRRWAGTLSVATSQSEPDRVQETGRDFAFALLNSRDRTAGRS